LTASTEFNISDGDLEGSSSSSPCTLSHSESPPSSPSTYAEFIIQSQQDIIFGHAPFVPDMNILPHLINLGVPFEEAKKALFFTGNCSFNLAVNWLESGNRNLESSLEEELMQMREDIIRGHNQSMFIPSHIDEFESDIDEGIDFGFVLLVNMSLNLSPGTLGLAGSRATARVTMLVKEHWGLDPLLFWDQFDGKYTEVRGVVDSEELTYIYHNLQSSQDFHKYLCAFDTASIGENSERKVLGVFGDMDDLSELYEHLPCL